MAMRRPFLICALLAATAAAAILIVHAVLPGQPRSVKIRVYQGEPLMLVTSAHQQVIVACGHSGLLEEPVSYDEPWTVTVKTLDGHRLSEFSLGRGSQLPAGGGTNIDSTGSGARIVSVFGTAVDGLPLPSQAPLTPGNPVYAQCGTN